jgi:hypothetical protein
MNQRYLGLVLTTLLLASAATPAVGAAPSAAFDADVVETTAGETAEIPVSLSGTDTATVQIGSDAVNYVATVVVSDGNGDGSVTLRYDTAKAGHDGGFAAGDADSMTIESETDFDEGQLIAPGAYDLAVAPGDGGVEDATGVATLQIGERPASTTAAETATPGPYAGHVADVEGGVVVAPARNQTITGALDLEPGTEVTVSARSPEINLLRTATATLDDGGRFRVSMDFDALAGQVENGTTFEVSVRADGERQKEVEGVFRTPPVERDPAGTTAGTETERGGTTDGSESDGSVPGFGLVTGVLALLALRRGE